MGIQSKPFPMCHAPPTPAPFLGAVSLLPMQLGKTTSGGEAPRLHLSASRQACDGKMDPRVPDAFLFQGDYTMEEMESGHRPLWRSLMDRERRWALKWSHMGQVF
jgi:hypothetical protein